MQASYDAWAATTDADADAEPRASVLAWVVGLHDGPPTQGILDPFSKNWFAEAGDTGVWIEYVVLPDLVQPAIVIRHFR